MNNNSFFDSPKVKAAIEQMYYVKLDELNITYEFQKIETTYGTTNIIHTGQSDKPPLVLIHGSNGCAPIAIEAMIGLLDHYKVYAIDVIGQPNLSEGIRPNMKDDTYGKWMYEILTRLNIKDATLVGISFGGFISWKTLIFDEKRIKQAFLIVPAGIVNGNPLKALWKVFLPMKRYQRSKNTKYVHQFLNVLFTAKDQFAFDFLSKVFLHFEMDFSPIPTIKAAAAREITTSLHIIAAKKDVLFPGAKMIKRVKKIFPSLEDVLLLPDSKHVPNEMDNERIVEYIKQV